MLQHKDMTLSELVDAWERQEDRIKTAESRYVELQEAVKTLKEDAALVHQRYLEEKQRREITDRRMTEMVLERVERDRTQATQTEIARLRSHYAQVVDDASQLAVTLQMTTAALADAQTRASALETQVKQLETDAATDEIASTICALRRQYDSKLASLRAEFVDAQTERQLALTMAESRGRDQQRVQEALLLSRENNTEMSTTLLETLKRGPYTRSSQEEVYARQECEESRAALLDMTNRVHSAVEYLEDVQREVVNDRQDALQAFGSQLAELTASFEALCTRPSAPKAPSTTVDTTVGRAGRDADGEKRPALAADAETPSQQLQQLQLQESNKVMKRVVQDSLEFVAGQLESTEQQRNHMVDASLSDAQYVAFMVDKLRRVTADRDALRAELKRSYGIIEQNHLAVVEHALMHDVSVEDSINAAEAAEQIESLRQELAALQQGRDAALAEVKHARADSGDVATRLAVADREKTLLETQVKRLTDALHSSFRREAALHKRTIDLHGRLEALAESHRALEESCSPGAGAEDGASQQASLARLEQMAERVEEQLGTCQRLLTERKEEEQQEAIALAAQTVEDLEADLARCGLHKVATLLYEALAGSRMLQNTVDMSVLQRRSELAAAAITEADVTPEMKIANLTLRNHQLSEDLAALKQHRVQYEERLQSVTEAMGKSEMHTKRLLEVSNRLLEEKNRLGQKVVALQAEVDQLRLPPPPATPAASATTDPTVDAATTGAPPPLTVEPGTETEGPAATDGETHSEAPLAESAGSAEHEETPADIAEPPHPTADEPSS